MEAKHTTHSTGGPQPLKISSISKTSQEQPLADIKTALSTKKKKKSKTQKEVLFLVQAELAAFKMCY